VGGRPELDLALAGRVEAGLDTSPNPNPNPDPDPNPDPNPNPNPNPNQGGSYRSWA
jgi:hypothetical protein